MKIFETNGVTNSFNLDGIVLPCVASPSVMKICVTLESIFLVQ